MCAHCGCLWCGGQECGQLIRGEPRGEHSAHELHHEPSSTQLRMRMPRGVRAISRRGHLSACAFGVGSSSARCGCGTRNIQATAMDLPGWRQRLTRRALRDERKQKPRKPRNFKRERLRLKIVRLAHLFILYSCAAKKIFMRSFVL